MIAALLFPLKAWICLGTAAAILVAALCYCALPWISDDSEEDAQ